jgi:hypothetical protein
MWNWSFANSTRREDHSSLSLHSLAATQPRYLTSRFKKGETPAHISGRYDFWDVPPGVD